METFDGGERLKKIPFQELPVRKTRQLNRRGACEGVDELGCLNFLTPKGIVTAARLVKKGKVFRLDTPINYAKPPLFNRNPARHTILSFEQYGLLGHDDLDRTRWTGPEHAKCNRATRTHAASRRKRRPGSGAGRWASLIRQVPSGFVGRGILVDVWYLIDKKRPIDPLSSAVYSLKDIKAALRAQRTEDRARFDPSRSHGMAGRILEGVRPAEGGNGAARSTEVMRSRAQQRAVRMAMGQSLRCDRHRLPGGRAVAMGFQGRGRSPLSDAVLARTPAG